MELNEDDDGKKSSIALKLWVEDPKKLKGKYKDSGAIEFSFDLLTEVPEVVAQEMVNMKKEEKVNETEMSADNVLYLLDIWQTVWTLQMPSYIAELHLPV